MTTLVTAGLLFISFGALAAGFQPWTEVLESADTDHDGKVSPSEVVFFEASDHFKGFQPFMADHFQDFDSDGDGLVSLDECRSGMKSLNMTDDEVSEAFYTDFGFQPRSELVTN